MSIHTEAIECPRCERKIEVDVEIIPAEPHAGLGREGQASVHVITDECPSCHYALTAEAVLYELRYADLSEYEDDGEPEDGAWPGSVEPDEIRHRQDEARRLKR